MAFTASAEVLYRGVMIYNITINKHHIRVAMEINPPAVIKNSETMTIVLANYSCYNNLWLLCMVAMVT